MTDQPTTTETNPTEEQQQPTTETAATEEEVVVEEQAAAEANAEVPTTVTETVKAAAVEKWAGWPGDNVFRIIVPVLKVGSIIGRKGELVKKMCDETKARIRVLDAPPNTPDRVVLVSGKEEPDSPLSPAMDAVIRVFKRVTGVGEEDKAAAAAAAAFCSMKLLVPSTQAINLIGKQGSTIKGIQESSGATVRVLPEADLPAYATPDERIVEIHGEAVKVQKAVEAVLGHLRKFLHDHSVVAVFEKTYNATISQDRTSDTLTDNAQSFAHLMPSQSFLGLDHSLPLKRESYFDRDIDLETKLGQSAMSIYGDPLSSLHSTGLGRSTAPIVTQITQTMQVPLAYAEDIIGIGGRNIAHIRRTSGAVLTVQESHGRADEITVEIKGTATQVQTAQQLIQESINGRKASAVAASIYGKNDLGLSSAYSQLPESTYSSAYSSQGLGGAYTSGLGGLGGYGSYRF